MAEDESGWEPKVVFVLCQSEGGPYEDEAFVAGFNCGWVHELLANTSPSVSHMSIDGPIDRNLLPQIDLLAMNMGWNMLVCNCEPQDPDFANLAFERTSEVPDGIG